MHGGTYLNLPGVRLWYVDSGGEGIPLVLLHANTGTCEAWRNQIDFFSLEGFRVIAFDRRGWGKSLADPLTGVQPSSVAQDLDALADHLQLSPFYLLGIAGGGFAALDFAAWRPECLRGLVISASNGQFNEPEMQAFCDRISIPGLTGNHELRRFLEVGVSYRAEDPKGFERFVTIEHSARQINAPAQPMRTPNTFAKISTIQAKTLVMSGGADLLAPPALMHFWARHLCNVSYVNIPDAGHALNWERPKAFNEQVLSFLRSFD